MQRKLWGRMTLSADWRKQEEGLGKRGFKVYKSLLDNPVPCFYTGIYEKRFQSLPATSTRLFYTYKEQTQIQQTHIEATLHLLSWKLSVCNKSSRFLSPYWIMWPWSPMEDVACSWVYTTHFPAFVSKLRISPKIQQKQSTKTLKSYSNEQSYPYITFSQSFFPQPYSSI